MSGPLVVMAGIPLSLSLSLNSYCTLSVHPGLLYTAVGSQEWVLQLTKLEAAEVTQYHFCCILLVRNKMYGEPRSKGRGNRLRLLWWMARSHCKRACGKGWGKTVDTILGNNLIMTQHYNFSFEWACTSLILFPFLLAWQYSWQYFLNILAWQDF